MKKHRIGKVLAIVTTNQISFLKIGTGFMSIKHF